MPAFSVAFAQTATQHTLQDYGISAETAKYLSEQEMQNILHSKTPAEVRADIEKNGTPEQKAALANPQLVNAVLPNTVNCFDYYHFGSVQTNLTSREYYATSGDEIKFSGPVTNQNDYPIVNGTLYVKIFRTRSTVKENNGPDVVDQFVAVDNLIIPAKSSIPVSFSWKVPESTVSGEYRIASFFITDKKFNLLGLSFTDDVIGNAFNFQVSGKKTNVQFDKAGVTINETPYFFAAYPPRIESKNPAIVSAKIINTTSVEETVNIVWKLYKWDSINPDNFIRTSSQEVTVKANSSAKVGITIPEADAPVYYLVGEMAYKDSKSILGIRFIRPEVDKIRLNFPSITNFPIKQGTTSTMFSCLHNSGTSQSVPNGKLLLKITDTNGKIVNEYTYNGSVTGEMMAVKNDFKSKVSLDHFFLTAQLWQADKLVDQSIIEYDCNKIDAKLCNKKSDWLETVKNNFSLLYIVLGIVILLVVVCTIIIFVKKKK